MTATQYIGARYVPKFAEPDQWDGTVSYEPLTIVLHEGNSYTSAQYVPVGVDISNTEFWKLTGNYNAQVEAYRKEVSELSDSLAEITHFSGEETKGYDAYLTIKDKLKTSYGYIKRNAPDDNLTPYDILLPYDVNQGGILNDNTGWNDFDNDIMYSFNRSGAWNWKNATIKSVQNVWGLIYPVDRTAYLGDVEVTIKPYGCVILSPDDYEIPQTQIYRPFKFSQKYLKIYNGQDASVVSYDGTSSQSDFGKVVYKFDANNLRDKVLHFWSDSLDTPDNAVVVYKIGLMCNKPDVLAFNLGMDCKVSGIQEIGGSRAKIIGKGETITYMCSSPEFARMNPNFDINYRVGKTTRRYQLSGGKTATVAARYSVPARIIVYGLPDMSNIWEALIIGNKVVYTTDTLSSAIATISVENGLATITGVSNCMVIVENTELQVTHNEAILAD